MRITEADLLTLIREHEVMGDALQRALHAHLERRSPVAIQGYVAKIRKCADAVIHRINTMRYAGMAERKG